MRRVMRKPDTTKNTSTPKSPRVDHPEWNRSTETIASPRSPSMAVKWRGGAFRPVEARRSECDMAILSSYQM
jgi:hypothetical protein